MNATRKQGEPCPFPTGAWTPEFIGVSHTPSPLLPPDWAQRVKLDSPPTADAGDECAALNRMMLLLRPARRAEIEAQAGRELDVLWPVQKVLGSPDLPPHPATKRLVGELLSNIRGPLFHFKEVFNRGRPYHCCAEALNPMFPWGDPLHPGHPAYPSGHSTQAHSLAYLYAVMFPSLELDLLAAADRVARNREIAGVHYPSDTEAGKALALQLVDLLLNDAAFVKLVRRARTEWQ